MRIVIAFDTESELFMKRQAFLVAREHQIKIVQVEKVVAMTRLFLPAIVIFDSVINPDTFIGQLRNEFQTSIAIIVLTSADNPIPPKILVQIFDRGADDVQPINISGHELDSRCKALVRRLISPSSMVLKHNGLAVYKQYKTVFMDGRRVELPKTLYLILVCLMEHMGQTVSPVQIYNCSGGQRLRSENVNYLIASHISRLRRLLSPNRYRFIETVSGYGYVFKK